MAQQLSNPILIEEDGQQRTLTRLSRDDRGYDESWLQKLLFDHTNLVPIGEIEPAFAEHVSICRELPTPAGPVDLLYMNPKGFITLVETKLWRNPEARRSVVAQIIDYTKEISKWSYEDLADAVRRATGGNSGDPFIPLFEEDEDFEEATFIDSVSRNLRLGRFLLLIVGDGIREGIEHMVEYLQETPQLHFTLGLVEVGLYRVGGAEGGPLLVQPRILARTQEITRAVVEIKIPIKREEIEISIPAESETRTGSSDRKKLTEDLFFEELEKQNDPKAIELARWVLDNAESYGLEIHWGAGGPLIKWNADEVGDSFTFGQLTKGGNLGYTGRLWGRCKKLGLPVEIARDYFDRVATLIPGAVRMEFTSPNGWVYESLVMGGNAKPRDNPPLAPLADHKEEWFKIIQDSVIQLQDALSAQE